MMSGHCEGCGNTGGCTCGVSFDTKMEERLYLENAKLREELETERLRLAACGAAALGYFNGCKDEYRSASLEDVLRLRQRAEASEARIKEAEGQEPVAWVDEYNDFALGKTPPEDFVNSWKPLYTRPIPPADVAELQAKLDAAIDTLAERDDKEARQEQRITELERQVSFWQNSANEWKLAYVALGGTASDSGREELNALLAKARAEAVPEWMPIETAPKTTKAILVWCEDRKSAFAVSYYDDCWNYFGGGGVLCCEPTNWMPLPAAPKPGEEK